MTQFEIELQKNMQQVADKLKEMGNGYGWTVEAVLNDLLPLLQKHVPGFDPANVVVDCEDF